MRRCWCRTACQRDGVPAAAGAGAGRERAAAESTSILQIVTLTSPTASSTALSLSNYATINLPDELARLPGVGNVTVFGVGQYAMRIWLDPQKLQACGLQPTDVIDAIRQQNQQVPAGQIGMPPAPERQAFSTR